MLGLSKQDWQELRDHTWDECKTVFLLAVALCFEVLGFIGDMSDEEVSQHFEEPE